jgi:hypothetical protein
VLGELAGSVQELKLKQATRLEYLYREAVDAWESSKPTRQWTAPQSLNHGRRVIDGSWRRREPCSPTYAVCGDWTRRLRSRRPSTARSPTSRRKTSGLNSTRYGRSLVDESCAKKYCEQARTPAAFQPQAAAKAAIARAKAWRDADGRSRFTYLLSKRISYNCSRFLPWPHPSYWARPIRERRSDRHGRDG